MNAKAKVTGWPGLKYVPVFPVMMKLFRRKHRDGRKRMMRFFLEHGMSDMYVRAKALHDDPSLNGSVKMKIYQGIENDYIKLVSAGTPTAAVPETKDTVDSGRNGTGDVDVPAPAVSLQAPVSDAGAVDHSGSGKLDGVGVSGLEIEIVGDE